MNSIDAGIHFLPEKEQIIQFYGEWSEGDVTMENGNLLDISVQVFDQNGKLLKQSYLFSSTYGDRPKHSIIDWVDQNENFYIIDFVDSAPVVRRFALDL